MKTIKFAAVLAVALTLVGAGCTNKLPNNNLGQSNLTPSQAPATNTQQEEIDQLKAQVDSLKKGASDKNESNVGVQVPARSVTPPPQPKDNTAAKAAQQQEDAFQKKQVCNEYLEASITKAKATEWQYNPNAKPGNGSMTTLSYEIFYSPKTNSCLFAFQDFLFNDEGKLFWIQYHLQDVLAGKDVESDDDLYADRSTDESAKQSDDIKAYWNSILLPSYH